MAMHGSRRLRYDAVAMKPGLFAAIRRTCAALAMLAMLLCAPHRTAAQKSIPGADLVIATPVADMFRAPSADSDVVSQAIYGTGVLSLEKRGDWYRIRTADNYTGWIQGNVVLSLAAGDPYTSDTNSMHVTAISANLYREPDVTKHAPLLQLPWEARIEVQPGQQNGAGRWIQVTLVDGRKAWVQRGDVEAGFAPLTIPQTLTLARRFLGITYTWGGVSSFGFDCSGFTQMLVRQRGIEMPRDADVQAGWSGVAAVERADLQPGDLLYFGSSATHITHTGMYIGNGEFIHDTTHDHPGVQISRLDDQPWTKLLVAARRIK
jgi:cell wall-associated NlpC family hydrolase